MRELSLNGYHSTPFDAWTFSLFIRFWRDAFERENIGLFPILPNTRIWMAGDASHQWSYTDKGKIIEIANATLLEPEEHYINYLHLIPPSVPDPQEEAKEKAECSISCRAR